jgi:hypothetical protein
VKIKITAVALLAAMVIPIAGCGGSTPHKAATPRTSSTAAAAPSPPHGCSQASTVVAAAHQWLDDGAPNESGYSDLSGLGKSLPDGELRLDVDRAALAAANFRRDKLFGDTDGMVTEAKNLKNALSTISRYCAS